AAMTPDLVQVGALRFHEVAGIARAESRLVLVGDAIRISGGGERVLVEKDVGRAEVDIPVRVGHHLWRAVQQRCAVPERYAAVNRLPHPLAASLPRPVPHSAA